MTHSADQNSQKGQPESAPTGGVTGMLRRFVEHDLFQRFIMTVIVINAVTLGMETSATIMARWGALLLAIDKVCLAIFVGEILLKLFAYRLRFFTSGWNVFDFVIVGIALMPSSGAFSVLRALRILRVLRLLSVVSSFRSVVEALFRALPGMGAIVGVLLLLFYVAAVISTKLFAGSFPDWFGTIGKSMYTLFQIMTLESWSMGIVRPVMERYPEAWIFFVPFVIITSFAVLNLFIGIIVNSLHEIHEQEKAEELAAIEKITKEEGELILDEVRTLREELGSLRKRLEDGRYS